MIEVEESTLKELASLVNAIKDSATPALAERITTLLSSLGVVAAEVEPVPASTIVEAAMSNADELATAIRVVGEWQRTGTWAALTEAVALLAALRDSATPAIAERLAGIAIGLGQIAGEAGAGVAETVGAVEEQGFGLAGIIRQVGTWQSDGTWDAIVQLAGLARGLNDSLSPQIVERVTAFAADAVLDLREALDSGLLGLGVRATDALNKSVVAAGHDTTRITLTGLMRSLKEPEIQFSIKVMMGLLRRMSAIVGD